MVHYFVEWDSWESYDGLIYTMAIQLARLSLTMDVSSISVVEQFKSDVLFYLTLIDSFHSVIFTS